MIHIIDDYYAEVDAANYTLVKCSPSRKGDGINKKTIGYVGTFEALIDLCVRSRIHDGLEEFNGELHDALAIIRKENTETRRLIHAAIGRISEGENEIKSLE